MFLVSKKHFDEIIKDYTYDKDNIIKNYESLLNEKDKIIINKTNQIEDLHQTLIDLTMSHRQEIDLINKRIDADRKKSISLTNKNSKARAKEKAKAGMEISSLKSKLNSRDDLIEKLVSETKSLNEKINLLEKANNEYCSQIAEAKERIIQMTDYLKDNKDKKPTLEDLKLYFGPKAELDKYVGVSKGNGKKVQNS